MVRMLVIMSISMLVVMVMVVMPMPVPVRMPILMQLVRMFPMTMIVVRVV